MEELKKFCYNCGQAMSAGEDFCPECGTHVPDEAPAPAAAGPAYARCPKCGFVSTDGSMVYCPQCASPLRVTPRSAERGFTAVCPKCGSRDESCSSRYCAVCGSEYALECGSCHTLNPFAISRCSACGSPFNRAVIPPKASQIAAQQRYVQSLAVDGTAELKRRYGRSADRGKDYEKTSRGLKGLRTSAWAMLIFGALLLVLYFTEKDTLSVYLLFPVPVLILYIGMAAQGITLLACCNRPSLYYRGVVINGAFDCAIGTGMLVSLLASRSGLHAFSYNLSNWGTVLIILSALILVGGIFGVIYGSVKQSKQSEQTKR